MSTTPHGRQEPLPAALLGSVPHPVAIPDTAILDALAAAAAAATMYDVATAVLSPLTALDGVRAGAVVLPTPAGFAVAGSVGYGCDTFTPGQVLPLDAGLPVTEAARTGRSVVQGTGPSWVAVPVRGGGALLLSLIEGPPTPSDVHRLERLGRAVGPALTRAARADAREAELVAVETAVASHASIHEVGVAVRAQAFQAELSGDVAEVVDTDVARWLLVADVRGRGAGAAVPALRVRSAFCSLAPLVSGPSELLVRLEAILRGGEEDFVTAVAIESRDGGQVRIACAGHPVPLLRDATGVRPLEAEADLPIGLSRPGERPVESSYDVAPGSLLVAYTDGLVDRRPGEVDVAAVLAGLPPDLSVDQAVDALLAAADAVGRREDDTTVAVMRLR